ncbi:hypothetical protein AAF463_24655 (plasmid) [Pantoea sp. BJ2]|uniref:Uncharacterized protein n=1 Tax=Pantoea sp. BJ2 TaxID=3141322 RepID=A0AAU7U3T0_9GAMM
MKVYGTRSSEVSNRLFPLQKDRTLFRKYEYNQEDNRVSYKKAFIIIVAGQSEPDPVESVYKNLWANPDTYGMNGERMAFYVQWVHYWSDLKSSADQDWVI